MSKTTAQLAELLSASNEQLFDRYVNVKLYQQKPKLKQADLGLKIADDSLSFNTASANPLDRFKANVPVLNFGTTDFAIRTPPTGLKPSITVSGQFLLTKSITQLNVTIQNMNANIDTLAYNWIEVELGYMNSGISMTFLGQITNCYMAKPNPNGELVIGATNTNVQNLYARGDFEVEFDTDVVTTDILIDTCLQAVKKTYPDFDGVIPTGLAASIPPEWLTQEFTVGKAVRHFRSAIECIAWLNSLFATYIYGTGFASGPGGAPMPPLSEARSKLPPIRLGFDAQGNLRLSGLFSHKAPAALKSLSVLGSAFLTSTSSATVTAPFNPDIMPGEVIYLDPKYFKTRVNIEGSVQEKYKALGNLWRVLETEFVFSTHTTNTMTVKLVNVDNVITGKDG